MAQTILGVRVFGNFPKAISFTAGKGSNSYGVLLARLPHGGNGLSFVVRRNRTNAEHALRKMAGRARVELASDLDLVINPHGFATARIVLRGARVEPFVSAIQAAYAKNARTRKAAWNVLGLFRSNIRANTELERAVQAAYDEFSPLVRRVLGG